MLLIEASNISSGGGHIILDYLLNELSKKNINFYVIIGKKCPELSIRKNRIIKSDINFFNRKKKLKKIVKLCSPKNILCFGNFPIPFKYNNGKVFTYFHRPYLLNLKSIKSHSFSQKLKYFLKKKYLSLYIKNSNYFIFQTKYIMDEFIKSYSVNKDISYILPFFDLNKIKKIKSNFKKLTKKENAFIYVSNDAAHKNHENLFLAWEDLLNKGMSPKLYVTIPKNSVHMNTINTLNNKGCRIENLGFIAYDKILKKLSKIRFSIFPSYVETLGLGLVESVLFECKVIASNRRFVFEIISPNDVFDPENYLSISKIVNKNLKNNLNLKSKIKIKNKIDELINLITK
tara:strand:- start:1891 stop:2925 length:1035 start_codon:yes stop_codon:yes gene_type:complete